MPLFKFPHGTFTKHIGSISQTVAFLISAFNNSFRGILSFSITFDFTNGFLVIEFVILSIIAFKSLTDSHSLFVLLMYVNPLGNFFPVV